MKNTINLIALILLTTVPFYLNAQILDINGDSRFRGYMDVAATPDSTSVYVGKGAGVSITTGSENSFFGRNAGFNNTEGNANSFFGLDAGNNNTMGGSNSFFGWNAGSSNTTGSLNSFFGVSAGSSNSEGSWNSFFGQRAGVSNTKGLMNTFFGRNAGSNNTEGNSNSFIGNGSGQTNVLGSFNTCIGNSANVSSDNLSNATALGYNASVNANNKVRIGNSSVIIIEGQVDWSFPSDARFKFNIEDKNVPGLDFINLLRPVTYQFDLRKYDQHIMKNFPDSLRQKLMEGKNYSKGENIMRTGFLAQEVEKACNTLGYQFNGLHKPESEVDNYSLSYGSFIPLLVKGVKEQQEMISAQELKMSEQEDRIAELERLVQQLLENKSEEKTENSSDLHILKHPQLMQNEPNPFNGMTKIHYFIPEDVISNIVLVISALDGREIKRIPLTQKGRGEVEIDAQMLPSGIYLYSLVVGHSLIETKKMLIQR